jgi:hypothetical protein
VSDVSNVNVNRKVLLFDVDHRRREIRAANLRTRGLDVLCAKSLAEVRDFWHVQTFRLVLLEATDCPDVVQFSAEVRSDDPRQRLAFFVGKPKYLAFLPTVLDDLAPLIPESANITLEEAFKSLSHKNGFVEASLRMQIARSARRGATTVKPVKDPWAAMKDIADAD